MGNPYFFTARQLDTETGLYYYRARYYSSKIGRFLQTDPVGYSAGINLYAYCSNNPINFTDPMGLCTLKGLAPEELIDLYNKTVKTGDQAKASELKNELTVLGVKSDIYGENGSLKGERSVEAIGFQTTTGISKTSIDFDKITGESKLGLSSKFIGFKGEVSIKVVEGTNEIKVYDTGGTRVSVGYNLGYGAGLRAAAFYSPTQGGEVSLKAYGGVGGGVFIRWRNVNRW